MQDQDLTVLQMAQVQQQNLITHLELPQTSTVLPAENVVIPETSRLESDVPPVTVKLFPIVQDVLIATVFALRFRLFGLVTVGVPEAFSKFNSFTPKLLSAIILFSYL